MADITVCVSGNDAEHWVSALRDALPGDSICSWIPGSPPADYAVAWSPPQQFVDEQGLKLKALFNAGAGVDALLKLKLPSRLPVVRLNDAGMGSQMAEYVSHALLRHFRDFASYEGHEETSRWQERTPNERTDFPVGVMGLGVLGERVARTIAQFDFPVLGWSRSTKSIEGLHTFSGPDGFLEFLSSTRVLVNLLPLTAATRNLLNRETLTLLRPDAYLINVARGEHLVDSDLLELINGGRMAGATLDVFREEPLPKHHPFWRHPKIRVTPHISARTLLSDSVRQIAEKLRRLECGQPVEGVVNIERGY